MLLMPARKKDKAPGVEAELEKDVKGTFIPKQYHDILKRLKKRHDNRSIASFVREAVREWLEKKGHLPPRNDDADENES